MITKAQAITAHTFHFTGHHACSRTIGPRGGVTERITVARRTGTTTTWKRTPQRFSVPVMHGLYEHSTITDFNAHNWHTADDCPLNRHEEVRQSADR